MTDIRDRLLAILKEPDRYSICFIHEGDGIFAFVRDIHENREIVRATMAQELEPLCDDLNADYLLKRICEEISNMSFLLEIQKHGTGPFTRENNTIKQIRTAILAIGSHDDQA